jgi:hypothetical protein
VILDPVLDQLLGFSSRSNAMDLGDFVVVTPRPPHEGRPREDRRPARGIPPDDFWYLVYLPSRMRSYLIPGSASRWKELARPRRRIICISD